jgi:hypothetical protein
MPLSTFDSDDSILEDIGLYRWTRAEPEFLWLLLCRRAASPPTMRNSSHSFVAMLQISCTKWSSSKKARKAQRGLPSAPQGVAGCERRLGLAFSQRDPISGLVRAF